MNEAEAPKIENDEGHENDKNAEEKPLTEEIKENLGIDENNQNEGKTEENEESKIESEAKNDDLSINPINDLIKGEEKEKEEEENEKTEEEKIQAKDSDEHEEEPKNDENKVDSEAQTQKEEEPQIEMVNQSSSTEQSPQTAENNEEKEVKAVSRQTGRQKKTARPEIPPKLKPYVKEDSDTLIYRALSGSIPIGIASNERQQLQKDLSRYVNVCINNDLIGEAVYVQGIANEIRNDKSVCKESIQEDYDELQEKIKKQKERLEEQNAGYDKQIEEINKEAQEKLENLEVRYQQAQENLDKEWSSPDREQNYTKPSAELLNLRHMLKKMVKSKQLDSIDVITSQIEVREKEESKAMELQMQADYEAADRRIETIFNTERMSILGMSEKKIGDVICEREKNARKYEAKIETLEREREIFISKYRHSGLDTSENKKKKATARDCSLTTTRQTVRSFNEQKLPDFVEKAKLPPPNFKPKKRTKIAQLYSTQPTIKKPLNSRSQSRSRLYDGL